MKELFSMSTVNDLHIAFDKYVRIEDTKAPREIEHDILKAIKSPMEIEEEEVEEPTSRERIYEMENAANIAASAFGVDHHSVKALRREIIFKKTERRVKQTTLFQFGSKSIPSLSAPRQISSSVATSNSPILSKPIFESSPSVSSSFSNLNLN